MSHQRAVSTCECGALTDVTLLWESMMTSTALCWVKVMNCRHGFVFQQLWLSGSSLVVCFVLVVCTDSWWVNTVARCCSLIFKKTLKESITTFISLPHSVNAPLMIWRSKEEHVGLCCPSKNVLSSWMHIWGVCGSGGCAGIRRLLQSTSIISEWNSKIQIWGHFFMLRSKKTFSDQQRRLTLFFTSLLL